MICDCDRFETFIVGDLVIFFKVIILYVGLGCMISFKPEDGFLNSHITETSLRVNYR